MSGCLISSPSHKHQCGSDLTQATPSLALRLMVSELAAEAESELVIMMETRIKMMTTTIVATAPTIIGYLRYRNHCIFPLGISAASDNSSFSIGRFETSAIPVPSCFSLGRFNTSVIVLSSFGASAIPVPPSGSDG